MINPKLSVVVPTHGRVDLFKETLQSLLSQTSKDFEIIVTDDSSLQNDRKEIKSLVLGAKKKGLNIRYLYSEPNLRQAKNTNQGLREAKGKYIRILHSDDLLAPECIEMEIKAFENHPQCNFLTHSAINFTNQVNFTTDVKWGYFDLKKCWLDKNIFLRCALPTTLVFKKEVYERIGGMNEQYDFLCDWDFFFRILLDSYVRQEWTAMFYTKGLVGWRKHNNSTTSTMALICFKEHQHFIDKIIPIYKKMKIIKKKQLKENIKEAIDNRYDRVISDYHKYHNFKLPHIPLQYNSVIKKYEYKLEKHIKKFIHPIQQIITWGLQPVIIILQAIRLFFIVLRYSLFSRQF